MKKYFRFGSIIAICIIASYAFAAEKKVVNKVLATINGEAILSSEFDAICNPIIAEFSKGNPALAGAPEKLTQLKKEILEQMINEKIILMKAKKKKIRVLAHKIEQSFEDIRNRFPSQQEFEQELKRQGITEKEFKKKIEEQLIMMQLIDMELKPQVALPADEEAQKYYDENKKKMVEPEMVRARHILIKASKDATEKEKRKALKKIRSIKKKIEKGEKFEQLAQEYSEDTVSSQNGGDLGAFPRGMMTTQFEGAAFGLNVGEISDIIETEYGYHIIKCEGKTMEQKKSFNEVKDHIKEFLYKKNMEQKYTEWLENLRKKAHIKINEAN